MALAAQWRGEVAWFWKPMGIQAMPFNPISGVVTRIWKFVDQFTARDYALRSVFDQAFDDVVGSFNAALAYFFKNYSTRAEFEAATIPANVNYVIIAGLAYVRDTAGTAITSANGVKFSPYGTIMPEHWAENTVPFTTLMDGACKKMAKWLSDNRGPHRKIYFGNIAVSEPIKFGTGDGSSNWSGPIENLTFSGGQIRMVSSYWLPNLPSAGIVTYPASIIMITGVTTYISENVKFENIRFDCCYVCGGIYVENTNTTWVDDCYFCGMGMYSSGVRTSIGTDSDNVDGRAAKNTELRLLNNKFRGGDSSASPAFLKRTLDGICRSQPATAGVPLVLDGTDIVGGEWFCNDTLSSRIGLRVVSINPQPAAGLRFTVHGFEDEARTVARTEQVTVFEWSTQWQHNDTSRNFKVVTQIVPDDTFPSNVAVMAQRSTCGWWIESGDTWTSMNATDGLDMSAYYNHCGSNISVADHPWSRKIVIGDSCYDTSFSELYIDFTDIICYSHALSFHDCLFWAGDCSIHMISSATHNTGDGFSFRNNKARKGRRWWPDGQLLKMHVGSAPWASVLDMNISGNDFGDPQDGVHDLILEGKGRQFAVSVDKDIVPGKTEVRVDTTNGIIFNTNCNGYATTVDDSVWFNVDGVTHAQFQPDGLYYFGVGLGTSGSDALQIDARTSFVNFSCNGHYAEGLRWNESTMTWGVANLAITRAVPATATSTGTRGEIAVGSTYLYYCIATDTWLRIAGTTW